MNGPVLAHGVPSWVNVASPFITTLGSLHAVFAPHVMFHANCADCHAAVKMPNWPEHVIGAAAAYEPGSVLGTAVTVSDVAAAAGPARAAASAPARTKCVTNAWFPPIQECS